MTKPLCSFNKFGYCRFDKDCRFRHVDVKCVNKNCEDTSCDKRHPKICFKLRDYGRCRFGNECKYNHSKPNDIAELDDKVRETKQKLENLENKMKNSGNENLVIEVDKKVEAFEKRLQQLVKAIEEKDSVILTMEKRVMTLENANTDNKRKLKDCENSLKKIQKNNENVKEKLNKIDKTKPKNLNCDQCDFSTSSQQGLTIHKRKKHTKVVTSDFPRKCDLCDMEFRNKRDMKLHINTHSYKEVQFKCEECDFSGTNEVSMEVHISKIHSEVIECGMCEYEAKDLESLEVHLVTCQTYECKKCGDRFQSISEIKQHMYEKHKGQEFLKIIHAKLDISNSEEIDCKTYYSKDLFPELFV